MKLLAFLLMLAAGSISALTAETSDRAEGRRSPPQAAKPSASQQMKIIVGHRVFIATLNDNVAAAAFKALLPLSLNMHDVNRNEKAFDLSSDLPTADAPPRIIRTGDLMIWNSRTVVVFYKNFSTPYRYTTLGKIEDPEELAAVLGAGNVTVTFELK